MVELITEAKYILVGAYAVSVVAAERVVPYYSLRLIVLFLDEMVERYIGITNVICNGVVEV